MVWPTLGSKTAEKQNRTGWSLERVILVSLFVLENQTTQRSVNRMTLCSQTGDIGPTPTLHYITLDVI